jgi:hypothetical protein
MDPYELARQQGQVMGQAGAGPDDFIDAEDLMDLLLQAYSRAGHTQDMDEHGHKILGDFAEFCNGYLYENRVASTGVVDGGFALVFDTGQSVQLASGEPEKPARPDSTVPITMPKSSKMRGMAVYDGSVPMTTGDPHRNRRKV